MYIITHLNMALQVSKTEMIQ